MFEWLFENDGCGNHHWGDGNTVGYKIKETGTTVGMPNAWQASKKMKYQCQHEGCDEYKYEYDTLFTKHKNEIISPEELIDEWENLSILKETNFADEIVETLRDSE